MYVHREKRNFLKLTYRTVSKVRIIVMITISQIQSFQRSDEKRGIIRRKQSISDIKILPVDEEFELAERNQKEEKASPNDSILNLSFQKGIQIKRDISKTI